MTDRSEPYLLTVTGGPNAGAWLRLGEGRLTIGGAESDDIILAGLGPRALDLRLAGAAVRIIPRTAGMRCEMPARCKTPARDRDAGGRMPGGQAAGKQEGGEQVGGEQEGGEQVGGEQILVPDRPCDGPLPVHLHLDEQTSILLARTAPLPASRGGARLALVALGLVLGAGLATGLGAQGVLRAADPAGTARIAMPDAPGGAGQAAAAAASASSAPASPRALAPAAGSDRAAAPRTAAAASGTGAPAPCVGPCIAESARQLRARLAEAGLDALEISAEQGVLRVSGNLDPAQAEAWRRIRAGFEAEHGQSLPVIATIGEGPPGPGLSVASVWLGAVPELRTRAGAVLRVGDVTPDGWTIRAIQRGAIRLGRGEQELTVRF